MTIKEKILQKGVTANQVAKMLGIHKSTLSKIISGKQAYVSAGLLEKIHTYLDGLNSDEKIK